MSNTQWITSAISSWCSAMWCYVEMQRMQSWGVIVRINVLQRCRPCGEVSFCTSLMALCHHDPRLTGAWASPGSAVEQLFSNSLCFPWPCQELPRSRAPHATAWGKCLLVQGSLQKLLQLRSAPWHLGDSSGTLLCHKLGFSGSSGPWGLACSVLLSSFYPSGFY